MIRELPEDHPDNELPDAAGELTPQPEDETPAPTPDATSANDDAGLPQDLGWDDTPADAPPAELGDAADIQISDPSPADSESTVSDASMESESSEPKIATESDWSNFVPAPGYADPETGKPRFIIGNVDESAFELMKLVHGLRPPFEPEPAEPGAEPTGPPPFLASPPGEGGGGPLPFMRGSDGGATPSVSIEVRVRLSEEELARISKESLRKAAEFSRSELLIVGRKVFEMWQEIQDREVQRRILAREY